MKSVKDKILKEHGFSTAPKGKHHKLAMTVPSPIDKLKTPAMKYIELRHGIPIEELLMEGLLSEVAYNLAIDQSTVSKWRKRLKLQEMTQ